jgi:hypothetical protein
MALWSCLRRCVNVHNAGMCGVEVSVKHLLFRLQKRLTSGHLKRAHKKDRESPTAAGPGEWAAAATGKHYEYQHCSDPIKGFSLQTSCGCVCTGTQPEVQPGNSTTTMHAKTPSTDRRGGATEPKRANYSSLATSSPLLPPAAGTPDASANWRRIECLWRIQVS